MLNLVATRRAGYAPDRHVPPAVHAAAVVREHAVRHGAGAHVRARRPGPRARLPVAGDPAGNRGRQIGASTQERGESSSRRGAPEKAKWCSSLPRARSGPRRLGVPRPALRLARALDAARAALPLARSRGAGPPCSPAACRRVARRCPARLVNSFAVPGTSRTGAEAVLAQEFGERPEGRFTVVFRRAPLRLTNVAARSRARLERAARVLPGGSGRHIPRRRGGVVYGELEVDALSCSGQRRTPSAAPRFADGPPVAFVSGQPAVQHDLEPAACIRPAPRRSRRAAFWRSSCSRSSSGLSLALAIPFVFAACTIAGTVALLYLCTGGSRSPRTRSTSSS